MRRLEIRLVVEWQLRPALACWRVFQHGLLTPYSIRVPSKTNCGLEMCFVPCFVTVFGLPGIHNDNNSVLNLLNFHYPRQGQQGHTEQISQHLDEIPSVRGSGENTKIILMLRKFLGGQTIC